MKINRITDLQDGTIAFSQVIDDELNTIHNLVNGKLASDNIAPATIDKDRLSFYVSSYWLDPVNSMTDLTALTPNHGEVCLVKNEPKVYIYDEPSHKWLPFLSTVNHNSLEGRDSTDAHPILAITGLRGELDGLGVRTTTLEQAVIRSTDLVDIDQTGRSDGKMLVFNATSGKLVYVSVINDTTASGTSTYSSTKIEDKLAVINTKDAQQDSAISLKENKINKSTTAPTSPALDDLWLDTSVSPNILNRWNGAVWVQVGGSGSGASKLTDMTDLSKTGKTAGKHIEVAPNGVDYIHVDKPINDSATTSSLTQTWSAKKVNDTINLAKPDLTPYQMKTDAGKVGTKSVSETGIATGKILKYDGANVVYADMPATSIAKQLKADLSVSVATNSNGAYKTVPFDRYTGNADGTFAGGVFTAGKDGLYIVDTSVSMDNVLNTEVWVSIVKDGEPGFLLTRGIKPQVSTFTSTGATVMSLTVGQKVHVDVSCASSTARIQGGASTWTFLKITKMPESANSVASTSQDHSHTNMPVLNALGDNAGTLTYNGVGVGGSGGGAVIDDANISTTKVWSSDKTNLELGNKANTLHAHSVSDITEGVYTKAEIDTKVQTLNDTDTGLQTAINGKAPTVHTHTASDITDLGTALEKHITRSNTAPSTPAVEDLWLDTTIAPNVLKRYTAGGWVQVGGAGGGAGATIDDTVIGTTTTYSSSKIDNTYSKTTHNHNGVYEPVITKSTAFNKDFAGTGTATTVAHSDHTHDYSASFEPKIATKGTAFNKDFAGTGTATTVSHSDHTHSDYSPTTHTHTEFANIGKVGTKSVDEGNIAVNKVLQWNGSNVVYANMPSTTGLKAKQTKMYLSANQTMATANTATKLNLTSNEKNETGTLDGTGLFTATEAGYYVISASFLIDNATNNWFYELFIYVNGAEKTRAALGLASGLNGGSGVFQTALAVGDTVSLYAISGGTTANVLGSANWTYLHITKLPEGGTAQASSIPKYASYASFPTGAAAGDVGMNTTDYKLYVYKPGVNGAVESPMSSDNVPSPQVASASSNQPSFEPYKAFDHNNSDYFCWASNVVPSVGSPQTLQLDLGSAKNVSQISVISRNDPTRSVDLRDFLVQHSSNGTDWTTDMTATNELFSTANETKTYTLPQVVNARYWRLYITANNGHTGYVCVGEFNLISSGNAWVNY